MGLAREEWFERWWLPLARCFTTMEDAEQKELEEEEEEKLTD